MIGIYDQSKNTLEMTLSNEHYLMRNADYVFIIKCKAVSDPKDGTTAIVPGKSYEYTNKASAWFESNKDAPFGGASQTQEWTKKESTSDVKPLGKNVRPTNNGETLNYTVTINPEGKKLLENSTEGLKIKDKLSVQVHPDYVNLNNNGAGDANLVTVSAELDEKNVKLYYAVKNSSTGELESTGRQVEGCKMTLESYLDPEHPERMLYIIHLTDVPDDEPLILRYTYTLVSDIDVHYESQWERYGYWETHGVQNTVELEGTSYETKLEPTATDYAYSGTSGNVMSTYFLTLKKVAKGDYTTLLPGAVFQLQKYENGTFSDVGDKTYTTDDSGTITIQQGKAESEFKFDTNTLYRLVEKTPPNGYAISKDETPVYFYFKDDADRGHALPEIAEMDQAVDLNSQSKQFYVENEPNLTSVTVEKKWRNADGTPLDAPQESIDFYLVKYSSKEKPVSGKSATVIGQIVNTANNKVRMTFAGDTLYTEDTVMTLKVTYPRRGEIQYNGGIVPVIYWNNQTISPVKTEEPENESGITWVYECKLKAGENQIYGKLANNGDSHNIEATYQSPTQPTNTEVKRIPYTLSSSDKWRMTIPDLPRSDKDEAGSTVYYSYKVEEINTSADYQVSYSTTNGVTSGLITMVNTKKPDKPDEPVYELPSTGSPGGTVPYTAGGAAIALAAVLCGYNSRRKRKRGEE